MTFVGVIHIVGSHGVFVFTDAILQPAFCVIHIKSSTAVHKAIDSVGGVTVNKMFVSDGVVCF